MYTHSLIPHTCFSIYSAKNKQTKSQEDSNEPDSPRLCKGRYSINSHPLILTKMPFVFPIFIHWAIITLSVIYRKMESWRFNPTASAAIISRNTKEFYGMQTWLRLLGCILQWEMERGKHIDLGCKWREHGRGKVHPFRSGCPRKR